MVISRKDYRYWLGLYPITLRKVRNQTKYIVYNKKTGKVYAKGTTLAKAKRQIGYLYNTKKLYLKNECGC